MSSCKSPNSASGSGIPSPSSECIDKSFKLHIKTDGDWTSKLRDLTALKYIGIDGPYGAPAQRFYDFDQAIIVGSGIGVTPSPAFSTTSKRAKTMPGPAAVTAPAPTNQRPQWMKPHASTNLSPAQSALPKSTSTSTAASTSTGSCANGITSSGSLLYSTRSAAANITPIWTSDC